MEAVEIEIQDSRIVRDFKDIKIGDIFMSELNHVCIKLDLRVDGFNVFDFTLNISKNFCLCDKVIVPNKIVLKVEI